MFLTAAARSEYSRGFIYNLVTNDSDAVQMMCNQAFSLFSAPLRIIIAMFLLYRELGIAAFAALVLLICMIPAQVRLNEVACEKCMMLV
jgi:ATP-binding cassette, subfamily C (CFTR/MRP), member 1